MPDSRAALHEFSGTLSAPEIGMEGTTPDGNFGVTGLRRFPGFSTGFFTHEGHLVPVERGILRGDGGSFWSIVLAPGRIWSEPGDGGWSRAAFPFLLVSEISNEAHNGLASFVFDGAGVSALRFQITQETASWNRHDFWGQAPLDYEPGPVPDEALRRAAFAEELGERAPVRAWQALDTRDPAAAWRQFTRGLQASDISASGVIVDGVIYMPQCATRHGDFPFCESMRHGTFSVTKSAGAALTLLRLAQKYGDYVFQLRIRDFVKVTATHTGWEQVTFMDTLNMATGIGDHSRAAATIDPFADENKSRMLRWALATNAGEKLDISLRYGNYPWGPGEVFRYNTTHTFVLAAAMERFLQSMEGGDARLWDMMRAEVLEPIGVRHLPMMHTIEADGSRGLPLMGIGLYLTVDELAKITALLHNGGRHEGEQLLSRKGVAAAMLQTGGGLPTGEQGLYGTPVYHMSFWSLPWRTDPACFAQLPYMSGFGGNLVVLLPNGITAFRFADADIYDIEPLARLASGIRPICTP